MCHDCFENKPKYFKGKVFPADFHCTTCTDKTKCVCGVEDLPEHRIHEWTEYIINSIDPVEIDVYDQNWRDVVVKAYKKGQQVIKNKNVREMNKYILNEPFIRLSLDIWCYRDKDFFYLRDLFTEMVSRIAKKNISIIKQIRNQDVKNKFLIVFNKFREANGYDLINEDSVPCRRSLRVLRSLLKFSVASVALLLREIH